MSEFLVYQRRTKGVEKPMENNEIQKPSLWPPMTPAKVAEIEILRSTTTENVSVSQESTNLIAHDLMDAPIEFENVNKDTRTVDEILRSTTTENVSVSQESTNSTAHDLMDAPIEFENVNKDTRSVDASDIPTKPSCSHSGQQRDDAGTEEFDDKKGKKARKTNLKSKPRRRRPRIAVDEFKKPKKVAQPKTPKPATPKRPKKRNYVKRKGQSEEPVPKRRRPGKKNENSCRRELDFEGEKSQTSTHELEITMVDECVKTREQRLCENVIPSLLKKTRSERRRRVRELDFEWENPQTSTHELEITTADECVKTRKQRREHVIPSQLKKTRSERRRRVNTMFMPELVLRRNRIKRRRSKRNIIPNCIWDFDVVPLLCEQLPRLHRKDEEIKAPDLNLDNIRGSLKILQEDRIDTQVAMQAVRQEFKNIGNTLKSSRSQKLPRKKKQISSVVLGVKPSEINFLVKKFKLLKLNNKGGRRKKQGLKLENGAIVPYQDQSNGKRILVKVELNPVSVMAWNKIVNNGGDSDEEVDLEKEKRWREELESFRGRIGSFMDRMHLILGDRGFKPWKGSVVDSAVGVFLTQNVSDVLSSSAYMTLASKYPLQINNSTIYGMQSGEGYNLEGNMYFVTEPKPERSPELNMDLVIERSCEVKKDESSFSDHLESNSKDNTRHMLHTQDSIGVNYMTPEGRPPELENSKAKGATLKEPKDWEFYRKMYSTSGPICDDHTDSVDWDAVRLAKPIEIAEAIKDRGQHNIIAKRIQDFLNRLVQQQGHISLEWLRNAPPELVKEYLLQIEGLGLKSVECIRLLSLLHTAFPVDVNVGRIAIRLGWVPLEPLPDSVQLHLLDQYPLMDDIQKYMWPRLRPYEPKILYELHYQLITFGKVFCTKRKPKCGDCPLRGECKHFASAFASARLPLPAPTGSQVAEMPQWAKRIPTTAVEPLPVTFLDGGSSTGVLSENTEPIVEMPPSPQPVVEMPPSPQPVVEMSSSPQSQCIQSSEDLDMEDVVTVEDKDDKEDIPVIRLQTKEFMENVQHFMEKNNIILENSESLELMVAEAAALPPPKLKSVNRLRTEHLVYVLPDDHILLRGFEKRVSEDPSFYLLSIWTPGETLDSHEKPIKKCNCGESELCSDETCFSCSTIREQNAGIVRGTILIPCRTATRGRFPLNGTYFQVNEVFADHETSINPLSVCRSMLVRLPRQIAYFGTSATSIFRALHLDEIQRCFWRGNICVRGFDRRSRAPKPLGRRFHTPPSKMGKPFKKWHDDE